MRQQTLSLVLLLGLFLPGCSSLDWLKARDNLNQGVRAYSDTNYEAAVEYFEEALTLDPELIEAELYLGMAYFRQFIPGIVSPDNDRHVANAVRTFESVLETDPANTTAMAALASLYQNTLQFDRAADYYKLQAEIAGDDPVPFYGVGSLAWFMVTDPTLDLTDEQRVALITEGQDHLDQAIALDEYYEDALIYKNLLYREEAGLIPPDSEDEEALARREELIVLADEWFERAMEARQVNAEEAAGLLE